jgi:hypothetical protein
VDFFVEIFRVGGLSYVQALAFTGGYSGGYVDLA